MTRKDVKGDQPSGGETTWTNTGATRYGRGQHKTGSFGDDMLRPSPNHGTQRLPNDDDDMLFQPNGNQNTLGNTLNIGVDQIEHKLNCKFLGIFIDNQLRWNNHLSHISAKLSRSVLY